MSPVGRILVGGLIGSPGVIETNNHQLRRSLFRLCFFILVGRLRDAQSVSVGIPSLTQESQSKVAYDIYAAEPDV